MNQPATAAQVKKPEAAPAYVDHPRLLQWVRDIASLTKLTL